jgi:transposase
VIREVPTGVGGKRWRGVEGRPIRRICETVFLAAQTLTARRAAERFGVSVSYVIKARQRLARTGSATPRPQKPCIARKLVPFHDALRDRVAQVPDATLAEHREWLAETHGVVAGLTTIWKALKQLKLTLKKCTVHRPHFNS